VVLARPVASCSTSASILDCEPRWCAWLGRRWSAPPPGLVVKRPAARRLWHHPGTVALGPMRGRWPHSRDKAGTVSSNPSRALLLGSAILWLLGVASLFAGVFIRANGGSDDTFALWARCHDAAAALAALTIAALAWHMRGLPTGTGGVAGSGIALLGTISAVATALCLLLLFLTGASDMLYMLPQGGIGLWLIALSASTPAGYSAGLRVLGVVTGTGLVLVAVSFVMIALALGPEVVALVDARPLDVSPTAVASPLNSWGHDILGLGSFLGVLTYPLWAWLAARAAARARFALRPA